MRPPPVVDLASTHRLLAAGDSVPAIQGMMKDPRFPAFLRANPKAVPADPEARIQVLPFLYLMSFLYRRDYVSAAGLIWGPDVFTAEPQAVQRIWNAIGKHNLINILGAASTGKCLGPDVGVMMFDGSVKRAKAVVVGDILMGDDGTPRRVLVKSSGRGPMYFVMGGSIPWICNDQHILTVISRSTLEVRDIPLDSFLLMPDREDWYMFRQHPGLATTRKAFHTEIQFMCEGEYHGFVIDGNHRFLLEDFTVTHNTYSSAARFLLEWVLDPDHTLVRVMSVKEDHVIKNLFGDMQRLYSGSVIPLPGKADSSSIATPKGKLSGQGIFPIVIPRGPDAGGTIKGSKVKPRPTHPLFDTSSRTFLIIDEAQEVPESAYSEIPNLFSSIGESETDASQSDTEHTVIVAAANPKDIHSRWGKNCTNVRLWDEIAKRVSTVNEWKSDRGWFCIRINALDTENIKAGRTVFKRFITPNGVKMKLQDVGGDTEHPLIWSEVYGMFPPLGMMWDIIQRHWVDRSRREWLFESATQPVAGEDVGLTGDPPALASGRIGKAVAYTTFDGVRHDLPAPRWVVQVDAVGLLPLLADSQLLADESLARLKPLGVKPHLFGIDRTGVGQGTFDIMRHQWHDKVDGQRGATTVADVVGVHYAEAASELHIMEEDSKTPLELYGTVIGEMWYAAARFFEHDCIGLGRGVDDQTIVELVNRRGGSPGGKGKLKTVESKDDYKERSGGKSPDRADALTLLIHVARHAVPELRPKAPDTTLEVPRPATIFDRMQGRSDSGLSFGRSLDLGWQSLSEGKQLDMMKD